MLEILKLNSDVKQEEESDSLGGGGALPTDVYPMECEYMYVDKTEREALMCYGSFKVIGSERTVRFSECIMSKKSGTLKPTYTCKKTGDEKPLPGYTKVQHLATAIGLDVEDLSGLEAESKVLSLWDYDQSKEVPQEKQVLVDFTGKRLQIALTEVLETKMAKDDNGNYTIPTEEEKNINEFTKWLDEDGVTNSGDSEWKEAWLEKNQGKVKDKRIKDVPKSGAPTGKKKKTNKLKFD